jgi:hypothetical protein
LGRLATQVADGLVSVVTSGGGFPSDIVSSKIIERTRIMILGMSTSTFTIIHVIISLIGIFSGFVVLFGLLSAHRLAGWTALFLATTVLTSATGFLFHSPFGPAHVVGIISLVVLAVALFALYGSHLAGAWRWIYVVTALVALYLNVFVGVTQAFQKLSFLQPLAPTQSEPPFIIAQVVVVAIFVVLGFLSIRSFHPALKASA